MIWLVFRGHKPISPVIEVSQSLNNLFVVEVIQIQIGQGGIRCNQGRKTVKLEGFKATMRGLVARVDLQSLDESEDSLREQLPKLCLLR